MSTFIRPIGLLFVCALSLAFSAPAAYGATGDVTAVRIAPNGWFAEVDIEGMPAGGTYQYGLGSAADPSSARVTFTVTSQGYDDNGTLGTITRTVYGTETVRKPYPNQNQKDESVASSTLTVKVALSDFIYADDKNGGAGTSGVDVAASFAPGWYTAAGVQTAGAAVTATNNSTLAYPKVIGRWAWPGYERITGDALVESVAFHRFAQNGKPVAVVKYSATDRQGNTAPVQSVQEMTVSTRGTDANATLVYAATVPTANFTPGSIVEVNMTAYPWVGDESSVLSSAVGADGSSQQNELFGPHTFINDQGAYGVGYALVSPLGNDATGQVYASGAAAEGGAAFKTIGKAAEAIKAYHTSAFGRSNAGGGVILLAEGAYTFPGYKAADLGTMDSWLTVKRASTAAKANTSINSGTNTVFTAQKLKIEGLTLTATSTYNFRGRTATDLLWFDANDISFTSQAAVYSFKTIYTTQNTIVAWTNGMRNFSTTRSPYALVRGNSSAVPVPATLYAVLGNKNVHPIFSEVGNPAGHAQSDNVVYAFNTLYNYNSANPLAKGSNTTHGIAIVQNVLEGMSSVQPLLQVSADSNTATTTSNVILWHNTLAGQRLNVAYNETGTTSRDRLNWSQRFNSLADWNNKDDTFGTPSGTRVGSWPVGYNVGTIATLSRLTMFPGEFGGLYSTYAGTPAFVNDASYRGTGIGNGNYRLTASSQAINRTPSSFASYAVLPFDITGAARDSRPDSGAYEFGAAEPTPPAPTLTLTAGTTTVVQGGSTTLSWNATNASSCVASDDWSGTKATSGTETVGPLMAASTFGLRCTGEGGSVTKSVSIAVTTPAVVSPALQSATIYMDGVAVGVPVDLSGLNLTWDSVFGASPKRFTSLLQFASSTATTSLPWQF